ncbi:sensor histidine kinase [Pseudonocardia endophytica]|uniref:histidine kinase n=1 Tax=Pseudonocardia endophytica TaxID=401976 RepID=A0A4R1HSV9_PSEEN|nr:HAMP domain-containing sensor histidine kinase [Pseudonocardia endophytica]TCK25268.1 signal transduction histidine kinase [Pseudonocardia endophytica]
MRSRLLVIVLVLVGLLALGLAVPLALTDARGTQDEVFADRLTDTISFAAGAQRPLIESGGDTGGTRAFTAEVERYDQVYGVAVLVFDRSQRPVVTSRPQPPVLTTDELQRVQLALAGRRSAQYPLLLPWDDAPMVLAEPVLVDGEVVGAAVTVSPTDALGAAELRTWALLAGLVLAALLLGVLVALPLVRWILGPVRRLDEGTGRVEASVRAGGKPDPVARNAGPPELRQLSVSFDRMAASVTQAMSAQRAFVADASHQLRNPLTALRLRLSNLSEHVDHDGADDHAAALEEAERLSSVLDGLLALARAEGAPDGDAGDAVSDVDACVDDRLEAWRPLAEHGGVELVRSGPRGLRARIAGGGIEAVLDAVLDNALKYTPDGGRIEVRTLRRGDRVGVEVTDGGPGMSDEQLARATDRFWRAPGQSNVEGSGLGLAIAERTVQLAGGEFRLASPAGTGLCVTALLGTAPVAASVQPE